MKKKNAKRILAVCSAVILMVLLTTVCANAKSMPTVSNVKNFVKVEAYAYTHLKEVFEIAFSMIDREPVDLNKYFDTPEEVEEASKMLNIGYTTGTLIKTGLETINPQNTEQNIIPSATVKASNGKYLASTSQNNQRLLPEFSVMAIPFSSKTKYPLDVFLFYKDKDGNLIAFARIVNYNGPKTIIYGMDQIELTSDGRTFASGKPSNFMPSVKLAQRPDVGASSGIVDGLPVSCFVKITFEPGTYDPNIDLSNLGTVNCIYSLDYTES